MLSDVVCFRRKLTLLSCIVIIGSSSSCLVQATESALRKVLKYSEEDIREILHVISASMSSALSSARLLCATGGWGEGKSKRAEYTMYILRFYTAEVFFQL